MFYLVAILVFVSLLGAQAVFAGDESPDGNHPILDPNANACMAGGTLEGKCDSEAMWNAGWYLVRFEQGEIDHDEFPDDYDWVLGDHALEDDTHDDGSDHEDEICLEEVAVHEG
jgi:hypothetical protein